MSTIAARAKAAVAASPRTQSEIASAIGMTPDAFSRALNGHRGFGALELAELARELGADLHELITGEPDPSAFVVSARHSYDPGSRTRAVDSLAGDTSVLEDIRLLYRQAGDVAPTPSLPADPAGMRAALGGGFVGPFMERVEKLSIDVIRIGEIGTAWSGEIFGRKVIVLPTSGNWFWQNWSIAHELGHLILGHQGVAPGSVANDQCEAAASAFAAELLVPETAVREVCAGDPSLQGVARYLWDAGISTKTLAARLSTLAITPGDALSELLDGTTQKALRRHAGLQHEWFEPDPITARMEAAAQRHFPAWLINAHAARVLAGELDTGSLAWMTGIPPEQMDIGDAPPERELSGAELADLFG